MYPGKRSILIGGALIAPIVFCSLGMVGIGADHLTEITGNFTWSKLIVGLLSAISAYLLTSGYQTVLNGLVIAESRLANSQLESTTESQGAKAGS